MDTGLVDALSAFLPFIFNLLGASNPVVQVVTLIPTVIGAASVLVKTASAVAKVTPSTKDDELVGKGAKMLSKTVAVLDKIALNPDTLDARAPNWNKKRR